MAWVVSMLASASTELGGLGLYLLSTWIVLPPRMLLFGNLLLVCAAISGAATLLLTAVVLGTRRVLPPRSIVALALVTGTVPWATLLVILAA